MTSSKKVLVTGAEGQMGQSLLYLCNAYQDINFHLTDRAKLDICNANDVSNFIMSEKPDYIINFAAYTAVDRAEEESSTAERVNVQGAENLAKAARQSNATLIHISTDYVYDNELNRPLQESDLCSPRSIYGKTKRDGELLIQAICERHIILRCSWIYGPFGHNFLRTMHQLMSQSKDLRIVSDQIGTPGYSLDLCRAIMHIVSFPNIDSSFYGIYNLGNSGVASWFDFAYAIRRLGHYTSSTIVPIPSKEYPTPASRPFYSVMNTDKFIGKFAYPLRSWQDAVVEAMEILKQQS